MSVRLTKEDDENVAAITRAARKALLTGGRTTLRERVVDHDQHVTLEFTDFGDVLICEQLEGNLSADVLQRARLVLPTYLHCGSVPMKLEIDVPKAAATATTTTYVHTAHTQTLPFAVQIASATREEKTLLQRIILYVTNMHIDMPVSEVAVLEPESTHFIVCLNHMPTSIRFDFVRALKREFQTSISSVTFESNAKAKNEIQIELLRKVAAASGRKRKEPAPPPPPPPVKRQRKPPVPADTRLDLSTPPSPSKPSFISAITRSLGF